MASESEEPVSGGTGGQEPAPGSKDKDARGGKPDRSRVFGSLVTAGAVIAVAIVGGVINKKINDTQLRIQQQIAGAQQRSDLYALRASRETAVDSLRAEVFGALAQHVLPQLEDKEFRKVALLAAFHGNFSKHIDTRPVFEAFLTEIHGPAARHELRRLAKRVARRQADYIAAHGGGKDLKVLHWRPGMGGAQGNAEAEFDLAGHEMNVRVVKVDDKGDDGKKRAIGDIANTVDVEVTIDEATVEFSVSYLDAPYMDNVFVIHPGKENHRVALLLLDITKKDGSDYAVTLEALHFPANIIMPVDVPSAAALQKALGASDSHKSEEQHHAESG